MDTEKKLLRDDFEYINAGAKIVHLPSKTDIRCTHIVEWFETVVVHVAINKFYM